MSLVLSCKYFACCPSLTMPCIGGVQLFCGKVNYKQVPRLRYCSYGSTCWRASSSVLRTQKLSTVTRSSFTSVDMNLYLYCVINVEYPSSDAALLAKFKCHPTIPCNIPRGWCDINALWHHIPDDFPKNWSLTSAAAIGVCPTCMTHIAWDS